tara:strand:+ start:102 stop:395 length:294 start_codon:yes stop_codon:yes gene_type:complete
MALTGTTGGALHPGSGARGFTFGVSTSTNQELYKCPAGKIAYIYAGQYLKVDGLGYPSWATGGSTTKDRVQPFWITSGQTITSTGTSSYGMGIEIDA